VSAGEIWSVRDPEKFAAMRAPLAVSHPELDDFCDDYTAEFSAFCADTGKRHVVIGKAVHEAVDASLSAFAPSPYVVPSSGMIVIAEVLNTYAEAEATLAGFGHVGWEWHPFSAERQLVDSYIAAGRLKRLGGETLVSSSQGA
ncbi:Urease operon accessory protein, partial [Rhizobium ruizarguesonis]